MRIYIPKHQIKKALEEEVKEINIYSGMFSIDLGEEFVRVVRCKDCRSFMKHPTEEDEMCCGEWPFLPIVNPNDFCSDGRKKK